MSSSLARSLSTGPNHHSCTPKSTARPLRTSALRRRQRRGRRARAGARCTRSSSRKGCVRIRGGLRITIAGSSGSLPAVGHPRTSTPCSHLRWSYNSCANATSASSHIAGAGAVRGAPRDGRQTRSRTLSPGLPAVYFLDGRLLSATISSSKRYIHSRLCYAGSRAAKSA